MVDGAAVHADVPCDEGCTCSGAFCGLYITLSCMSAARRLRFIGSGDLGSPLIGVGTAESEYCTDRSVVDGARCIAVGCPRELTAGTAERDFCGIADASDCSPIRRPARGLRLASGERHVDSERIAGVNDTGVRDKCPRSVARGACTDSPRCTEAGAVLEEAKRFTGVRALIADSERCTALNDGGATTCTGV